jgi:hypothetical protein
MDAWSRAQPNLANTIGMLPGGQTMPSMNAGWQPPWTLNLADLGMLPGGQYANRTPPYFGY